MCPRADCARGYHAGEGHPVRSGCGAGQLDRHFAAEPGRRGVQRAYLERVALRRMGTNHLSPEHGTNGGGLALECKRNVERRRASERLLYREGRARRVSAPFFWISAPASRNTL